MQAAPAVRAQQTRGTALAAAKCSLRQHKMALRPALRRRTAKSMGLTVVRAAADEGAAAAPDPEQQRDEEAISDIKFVLSKLIESRDMTFGEVKLVLGIEDPRAKERRESLGVEDESGVSRDDIVYVLEQVNNGESVDEMDRMSLRKCAEEMRAWPYLDLTDEMKAQNEGRSSYASITNTGVQVDLGENIDQRDSPVPDWMGYGFLYGISVIPIVIGVTAAIILFVNSLR